MHSDLYDVIYAALDQSAAYRSVRADMALDLPDWLVPLSAGDRALLERVARAMRLRPGDEFVDLACGLGGSGIWIAQQTNARVVGVDFSPVAIAKARALAAELGLSDRARFVVADAAGTGLPGGEFAAIASIDSLQFVDAAAATLEMARLLRPGGIAAIATWEALTGVELPTVVANYEPYLSSAGLAIQTREVLAGARARELAQYRSMLRHADALRAEMGDGAEPLLHEAASGLRREHEPPRVRKVFIVAQKAA
jgi:ubiquinone/menaquinone biosynthesis C-methylase UbiE